LSRELYISVPESSYNAKASGTLVPGGNVYTFEVEAGTLYKREQPIKWKCSLCGYVMEGKEPPPKCPGCKNPKEYYEPANLDF